MELKVGDSVQWNTAGGTARGKISRIVREGSVAVPKSSFTIKAEPDDPAVLITLYRENKAEGGFRRQDVTVGHKMSTLTKIEDLEKGLDAMNEVEKRDYSTQERRDLAEQGKALPDGSFPIVDKTDLMNALQSIGRAKNRANALRHIRSRAKDLGMMDALPEWAMQKGIEEADQRVLDALRPYSDLSDEQWELLEDEVAKAGRITDANGTVVYALTKAKQSFSGNRSAAGAYAANVRWGRNRSGATDPTAGGGGGGSGESGLIGTPPDIPDADYAPVDKDDFKAYQAAVARRDPEKAALMQDDSVVDGLSGQTKRYYQEAEMFPPKGNWDDIDDFSKPMKAGESDPRNEAILAHNRAVGRNMPYNYMLAGGGRDLSISTEPSIKVKDIRPGMKADGILQQGYPRRLDTEPAQVTRVEFRGNKAFVTVRVTGPSQETRRQVYGKGGQEVIDRTGQERKVVFDVRDIVPAGLGSGGIAESPRPL